MIILIILDGWGYARSSSYNAITLANTPIFDSLWKEYPHTTLVASGLAVGLPEAQQGGSEVGHLNLGAGRIVEQDLIKINRAISDGSFYQNKVLLDTIKYVQENKVSLHILGLIGQGGIHSFQNHWYAFLELCRRHKLRDNVWLHLFTDGRDTPPKSSINYIEQLDGRIATISGRYYAMDRDKHCERTEKCFSVLTRDNKHKNFTPEEIIQNSYKKGITDEFILPVNINSKGLIRDKDAVISLNFRSDRPRQLCQLIKKKLPQIYLVTMTEYEAGLTDKIIFPPRYLSKTLSEIISNHNMRQLHIAETEKYAHVSYFFNGGREKPFKHEDLIRVPSPRVTTYDKKPEMSAPKITQEVIKRINSRYYDFILLNFANPDMVGHTGKLKPTIKAVEVVDECLGKILNSVDLSRDVLLITADHGNAENVSDTSHSLSPVPFILASQKYLHKKLNIIDGKLSDVAPTVLSLLNLHKPPEMTGKNMINCLL